MTKKKIILVILIALLAASLLYLSLVPIDLTERKPLIKSQIEELINGAVDMGKVSLYVLPYPRIRIDDFILRDAEETLIRSEKLRIGVSLLPLFKKHVAIKSLTTEGGEILVRMSEDGRISLQDVLKEPIFTVSLKSLAIENGRVRFIDEGPRKPAVFEMTGINANIYPTISGFTYTAEGKMASGGGLSFSGQGRLEGEGAWALSGTLGLTEFDIEPLKPYIKEFDRKDLIKVTDARGLVSLDSDYSFNVGGPLSGKGLLKGPVEFTDAALEMPGLFSKDIRFGRGSADLDLTWDPERYVLALSGLRLTVSAPPSKEEFIATGSFRLDSFEPFISINIATTPFELRTMLELLPLNILPDKVAGVLSEISSPGGRVAIKDLSFSGTPGAMDLADYMKALSLEIELERVTFKHLTLVDTPYGVTGSISLKQGNLSLKEISGIYGTLDLKGLDAEVKNLAGRPFYTLDLEAGGRAGKLLEELKRGAFFSAPDDLELTGEASAKLHVEGIWGVPGSITYSGEVELDGVDMTYGPLPLPLKKLAGEAAFDTSNLFIAWLRGNAGGSEFTLSGKVEHYRSAVPFIDFETNVDLIHDTLPLLVKGFEETGPAFTGPVYIKGHIRGEPASISIDSSIDATHTDMTYGKLINKRADFPFTLKSIVKVEEKNFVVEEGDVSIGGSAMAFAGTVSRDRSGYELSYVSEKILISDLAGVSPYISEKNGLKGTLDFAIKGRREAGFKLPQYEGKMSFKDWQVDTPFFKNPVTGTLVTSRFSGNSASIVIGDVTTGESSFSGKVEIKDISTGEIEFDLLSERINAADLLPKTAETGIEPFITGHGKITVTEGAAWGFAFEDFTTDIEITRERVSFPVNLTTHGGLLSGNVVCFRGAKEPLLFKSRLKLEKISLESLVEKLGAKGPVLSGRVDAEVELEAKRRDIFTEGLNGKVLVSAKDGRLWKFVVLRKVFTVVNIITINELFEKKGLPYKTINGSFNITDGVIRTEDLALDSNSLRMSAVGKINMPHRSIKATLALHPFVTIDKIVSKIPLAGWILTGEEGTVNMYYRITGPLMDPEVTPQPTKSVEKGILGILERIFEAPMKAFEPEKGEPSEEKKENETHDE